MKPFHSESCIRFVQSHSDSIKQHFKVFHSLKNRNRGKQHKAWVDKVEVLCSQDGGEHKHSLSGLEIFQMNDVFQHSHFATPDIDLIRHLLSENVHPPCCTGRPCPHRPCQGGTGDIYDA